MFLHAGARLKGITVDNIWWHMGKNSICLYVTVCPKGFKDLWRQGNFYQHTYELDIVFIDTQLQNTKCYTKNLIPSGFTADMDTSIH